MSDLMKNDDFQKEFLRHHTTVWEEYLEQKQDSSNPLVRQFFLAGMNAAKEAMIAASYASQ
jgi:hypothetical protein